MCLRTQDHLLLEASLRQGFGRASARAFAEPGASPQYTPDRGYTLRRIDLRLRIDPRVHHVDGVATLHVGPTPTGMGRVVFDLDEVVVQAVTDGAGEPLRHRYEDGKLEVLGLVGAADVVVRYTASPRRGMYFVGPDPAHPGRRHEVWTQCQDQDGHFVFPCFDHPSVKQPFGLTVEAPSAYTVIGNGRLVRADSDGAGFTTWVYEQAEPIPAYLVTVVVAELTSVEDHLGELSLRYLARPDVSSDTLRRVFGSTPRMMTMLSELTGVPFPWARYDQVVVADFIFGGMENVAATTLTDLVITDDEAATAYDSEPLIMHELGHQWFGDLVTCQDWSQAWLNEGWATFTELLWIEHSRGEAEGAFYAFDLARHYFDEAEGRYSRPIVSYDFREPIDVFDRHLYEKGACVLNTLRHELGAERFWPAVRSYLGERGHKTAHTRHFQRALEDATGRSLDGFFQQWVYSPGFPDLGVSLSWDDGLLQIKVEQRQSGEGVPQAFSFGFVVAWIGEDGVEQRVTLPVRERSRSWAVPCAERPRAVRVDPGVRVLARVRLEAPGGWLRAALSDDACPVMRVRAAEALGESAAPDAVAALAQALTRDPMWAVRAEVARTLGKVKGAAAQAALLGALDVETDARARKAIVEALASTPGPEVVARLLRVAEGDSALLAEAEAVKTLGRLRAPEVFAAAARALGRDAWADARRARALEGLGASRDPAALPILKEWTSPDRSPRARAAAISALGALGDELPELRRPVAQHLVELVETAPFRAQLSAIAALGRLRDPVALGVLGALHRGALDGRTRRAAYEAIADVRDGASPERALAGLRGLVESLERQQLGLRERLDRLSPPGGS
ncbi:HEAT repeat domain-containing protein [Myxococcota bacterium]|nr:HEAT repeat domain-containing protein [Myxococcota bacterium]